MERVKIGKHRISYRYRAGKDLILCIHGLGCAKECFDDLFVWDDLKEFGMLSMDLVGHGESSPCGDFSCSMEEHGGICSSLLRGFPHERLHLLGHSMGGAIGLLLPGIEGGTLKTFINVEGNLISQDCTESGRTSEMDFETFRRGLKSRTELFSRSSERGTRLWAGWIGRSDAAAFYRSSRSLVEWSRSGRLLDKFISLPCRKVYLYGSKNSSLRVIGLLGNIEPVEIPESGHFPMCDNPGAFCDEVARILVAPGG